MAGSAQQNKGKTSVRMWILLGIFLILGGLLVYNHLHQSHQHMERKLVTEDKMDY